MGYKKTVLVCVLVLTAIFRLGAEDGSQLWLRFSETGTGNCHFTSISSIPNSLALHEFQLAWEKMNGSKLKICKTPENNSLIISTTPEKYIRVKCLSTKLKTLGDEGFIVRTVTSGEKSNLLSKYKLI